MTKAMKKYEKFSNRLKKLESDIEAALVKEINRSKTYSRFISDCKVIKVNIFGYTELGIVNDRLTFMDNDGHHYTIDADCTLVDLIDILNSL